jgi:hypothetical protein
VLQVLLIFLAIIAGQVIHLYFKWTDFKSNAIAEAEDDFFYFLNREKGVIIFRIVIFIFIALWLGLTSYPQYIYSKVGDIIWPFYAFIGYGLDSFLRNLFKVIGNKKLIQ